MENKPEASLLGLCLQTSNARFCSLNNNMDQNWWFYFFGPMNQKKVKSVQFAEITK